VGVADAPAASTPTAPVLARDLDARALSSESAAVEVNAVAEIVPTGGPAYADDDTVHVRPGG
jgi:hypothetical protein